MNFQIADTFFLIFRAIGWIAAAICLIFAFSAMGSRQPDANATYWIAGTLSSLCLVAFGTIGTAVAHTAQVTEEMHKIVSAEINDARSARRAAAKQV